jgi:hypothetical protein
MENQFFVEHEDILAPLISYFEQTWIGYRNRKRTTRRRPSYDLDWWNCYRSVLEDTPRTNNNCEAFHRGLAGILGIEHPTIFKLIDGLKQQQSLTEIKIEQFFSGVLSQFDPTTLKEREKFKNLVRSYGRGILISYSISEGLHIELLEKYKSEQCD